MAVFEEILAKELATIMREQIDAATKPLRDKIERLEKKVAELQSKGVEYKGVWQRACSYERGSIVTFDGGMWVAVEDVGPNTQPAKSNSWQLAVQKGKDAKERAA